MKRREMIWNTALGIGSMMLLPAGVKGMFVPSAANAMTKADFGADFKWGTATAAYQIEGAWNIDGKGPSIWDTFTHHPRKIKTHENGDVACDFYHRYEEDLTLLKSMNMNVSRFSVSWSRIIPNGIGTVNPKGIEFYHKVIDRCLALGIEPWITLYHWDLPQALQDKGGWTNREVIEWFSYFANIVTKEYGSKVKHWMVLNEPAAFVGLGYLIGMHAPGKFGFGSFSKAVHHAVMCQAEGGRIIRKNVPGAEIGTTFSCQHIEPRSNSEKDKKACARMDAMFNRLYIEPALGLGYPVKDLKVLKKVLKHMKPGDEEKMKFDFDFIGVQNYVRSIGHFSLFPPVMWANQVPAKKLGHEITEMGWEVYPEGMYQILKQFAAYKGVKKIIVTENGAAFPDKVEGDRVHDEKRTKFYQDYLAALLKAKKEGINIGGYFVWSLTDNFEWQEGTKPRFGLVHIDYATQKRTIKDSGLWFRDFLKG